MLRIGRNLYDLVRLTAPIILLLAISSGCAGDNNPDSGMRQKIKMDLDWKFIRGDVPAAAEKDYDDSHWEHIDIPHDWAIRDTFSEDHPTGRPGGFASGGVGWYRKTFTLKRRDASLLISIEFGGVYENSEMWINGHYLGKRPFGYISFHYDLTPHLDFQGDNVLAVRVDNSKQPSARWYTGCGIYRHVWLVKTGSLHVARHGLYATTPVIDRDSALVDIRTTVENDFHREKQFTLVNELYSRDNELVAKIRTSARLDANTSMEIHQKLSVPEPDLWSPDHPALYRLRTVISDGNTYFDELETNIGIRYFTFSADSGFTLNGKSMKFLGVNNHSDLGALGAALNDRVLHRRLEILKEMGCNAIRTAHNPPCEELLDMCDSMGFMVMDEAFDEWLESWPFRGIKKPEGKVKYGYHLHFNEWAEKDLAELIRRDRNHPSVILWSVGNEIPDACFEIGTERLKRLVEVVRKEDPTRPITCGITHMHLANESGFASQLDVCGYNGGGGSCFMYEEDHLSFPERIFMATEVPHSFQTRGIYRTHSWYRGANPLGGIMKVPNLTEEEVFTDVPRYYSSSYDNAMVRIGARDSWRRTRDFPYMCGEFRWTGFDYLGETMFGWPARFWNFGIIDMCGFPKDTYYFYKSQWTEEPMVHIFPHWNWKGKEGIQIPVVAYSNCESIELFLNGKSLGEKEMGDKMDLVWLVAYEPGILLARGKREGKVVCEMEVLTAGPPEYIRLLADRKFITADRQEVVHVEVDIVDEDHNFVPDASNRLHFKVEGEAEIYAVDNGDPMNEENFGSSTRRAFNGKCLVILKSTGRTGEITLFAESEGLESNKIKMLAKN
jgi:beta-galactosidase